MHFLNLQVKSVEFFAFFLPDNLLNRESKMTGTVRALILDCRWFNIRVQARGLLRRNTRPDGVKFAQEGSGGEKTSPDICSFSKKSLLVLPVILKTN